MTTRKGKIARLAFAIREELNERLLDNQNGPDILAWINGLAGLTGAAAITPQNLSEWRAGGFAEWLEKRDKVERTKSLAEFSLRMAKAGGGSLDLPAAIAGGQLMEILEEFDTQTVKELLREKPESWLGVLEMLSRLQRSKADELKVKLAERQGDERLKQSDRALSLSEAKFRRQTAELFLVWFEQKEAEEIAKSGAKKEVKVDRLVELMFGKPPAVAA